VALRDRLNRLEGEKGPELCEERYCRWAPTFVEVIYYPDSMEVRVGREPPPLCPSCPYRDGGEPGQVSLVEVVKRY
jgi:hypothetical protein